MKYGHLSQQNRARLFAIDPLSHQIVLGFSPSFIPELLRIEVPEGKKTRSPPSPPAGFPAPASGGAGTRTRTARAGDRGRTPGAGPPGAGPRSRRGGITRKNPRRQRRRGQTPRRQRRRGPLPPGGKKHRKKKNDRSNNKNPLSYTSFSRIDSFQGIKRDIRDKKPENII